MDSTRPKFDNKLSKTDVCEKYKNRGQTKKNLG